MALEIGNKVRSVATVAGMALGGLTMSTSAATAQDVQNVLSQTTFSSMQEANSYAQANGMVLARANNGSMMFVTQELADLMVNQGFTRWNDGTVRGYESQNLIEFLDDIFSGTYEGYNFATGSDYLQTNSTRIRVEESQGDGGDNGGNNDGGGDDDGGPDDHL